MKHLIHLMLLVIMLMYSLSGSVFSAEIQDREVVRSIQELNEIRRALFLPLFSVNQQLDESALIHNRYMNYNNILSSIEDPDKTYYRGRYPWDRSTYAGYDKAYVNEMVGRDFNNFSEGWSTFMKDPYLRYNLLNPKYTDIGMDRYLNYSTYLLGGNPVNKDYQVVYPYSNQVNVPTGNSYYFSKNPYELISEDSSSTGFPLTYTYYSDKKVKQFEIQSISLIRLNTYQKVPITYLDNQIQNSLIILPLENFESFSTYELYINGKMIFTDGKTKKINHVSRFTTENIIQNKKVEKIRYLTRAEFVKKLIQSLKYDVATNLRIVFKDVSPTSFDAKYIHAAYDQNLIKGNNKGEFLPLANIKEQDVYVVLIRAYEKKRKIVLTDEDKLLFQKDISSEYAIDPLRKAVKIGLIDQNKESFDPHHYISVKEYDQILKRFEEIIK